MSSHRHRKNQGVHHHENGNRRIPPPPFYDGVHPALLQFMADTTRDFTEVITRISQPIEQTGYCSIHDFSSYNFRSFESVEGPNVAEAWLTDIEVLFNILGCTNEQRVQCIGLKLIGETGRWWTSRKALLTEPPNETVITLDLFKIEYNRRFFPRAQRQLWAIEFQNLVQDSMTVEQYSAKFMELARFATNLIPDEESKAERFENGLYLWIKERVICEKKIDF
jgi:hypothetical protein